MDRRARTRILGLLLAVGVLSGWAGTPQGAIVAEAATPAWHGGIDLYRRGVFTTQGSWLWCTAADIQIARNIVFRRTDHSAAHQRAYFDWMRTHNRYDLPLSAGVDPAGWAAGFRHLVDDRYRLVASRTFDAALRLAATRLRRTGLPVGITVDHGNHAWLLTGFTATADPLVTSRFTITSVRVTGPLFGLQSRDGYDMPPDTRLTPAQLRRFFTPWSYPPVPMAWDGRYVSIQPVPVVAAPGPSASPSPARAASPSASATAAVTPVPTASPAPSPAASPATPSPAPITPALETTPTPAPATASTDATSAIGALAALGVLGVVLVGAWLARRRRGAGQG